MPFSIHTFDALESTNTTAREWLRNGASSGTVIRARRQTAGRGRQGRSWASLPGCLMFSLLLRPHSDARHMARLGFAACVSAARAADRCGAPDCGIKWPNDLVFPAGLPYQNAPGLPPSSPYLKWGGILVETGLDAETRPWAIVGVGLNVGPVPADAAFDFPFTSLSSHGGAVVTAEEMLQFFLDEMEWCWRCAEAGGDEIWQTVRGEWRRRDILFGQQVRALTPSGAVRGTAQGIDDSGALRLETSHGTLLVDAGDVHLQPGG